MKKQFYKACYSYKLCSLVLALFLFTNSAFSQEKTSIIKGKITDGSGPLPGASIGISGTGTGAITDADGNYSLKVAPGSYKLKASYTGLQAVEKAVTVAANQTLTVDFNFCVNKYIFLS